MATGVQEVKLAAKMQEWSDRITECRNSGMGVKAWCKSLGIAATTYYYWEKHFIAEVTQQLSLPAPAQAEKLMRINQDALLHGDASGIGSGIIIRHGESVITLPAGSSVEEVAELFSATPKLAPTSESLFSQFWRQPTTMGSTRNPAETHAFGAAGTVRR